MMRWVLWLCLAVGALLCGLEACSSNTAGGTQNDASPDRTEEKDSTTPHRDAGTKDAAGEAAAHDAGVGECGLSGLDGFTWAFENSFQDPGACTPAELKKLIGSCPAPDGSTAGCDVDMGCYDCLFGAGTTPGAVLSRDGDASVQLINWGGCVQIADPDGGAACAHALQKWAACQLYDCRTCTWANDPTGAAADSCLAAIGTACDAYKEGIIDTCYGVVTDGGPAAACEFPPPGDSFAKGLTAVATVLCVN